MVSVWKLHESSFEKVHASPFTGRDPMTLDAASKELGSEVIAIPSDVGEAGGQKKVAETIRQAFGTAGRAVS